jgi:hypothetical protein
VTATPPYASKPKGLGPGGLIGIISGVGATIVLISMMVFTVSLPRTIDFKATPAWAASGEGQSSYATQDLYVALNAALSHGDRGAFMKHVSGDAIKTMTLFFDNMDALGWSNGAISTNDVDSLLSTPKTTITVKSTFGVNAGFTASAPRGSGGKDAGLIFIQGFIYDVQIGMEGGHAVITGIAASDTTLPWLEQKLYVTKTAHVVAAGYPAEKAIVDQAAAKAEPAAVWVLDKLNTAKNPLSLTGFTTFVSNDPAVFASWFNTDAVKDWKMDIAGSTFPTYRPDPNEFVDPLLATGSETSASVVTIGPEAKDQLPATLAHEFVHASQMVQVPSGFGEPPLDAIEGWARYMETLYTNGNKYPSHYARLASSLPYADPTGAAPTDAQLRGADAGYYYELAGSRFAYAAANGYDVEKLANFSKLIGLDPIKASSDLNNGNTLSDAGWLAWAKAN